MAEKHGPYMLTSDKPVAFKGSAISFPETLPVSESWSDSRPLSLAVSDGGPLLWGTSRVLDLALAADKALMLDSRASFSFITPLYAVSTSVNYILYSQFINC